MGARFKAAGPAQQDGKCTVCEKPILKSQPVSWDNQGGAGKRAHTKCAEGIEAGTGAVGAAPSSEQLVRIEAELANIKGMVRRVLIAMDAWEEDEQEEDRPAATTQQAAAAPARILEGPRITAPDCARLLQLARSKDWTPDHVAAGLQARYGFSDHTQMTQAEWEDFLPHITYEKRPTLA
ncbi:MAG: hypothetical protein ACRD3W_22575 [Terriglobales bacterium]